MNRASIDVRFALASLIVAALLGCGGDSDEHAEDADDAGADGAVAPPPLHGGHGAHGGTPGAPSHADLPAAPALLPIEPWDGDLSMPELEDENADPSIVEVTLTAAPASVEYMPGSSTEVWAYNGVVPGPLLRANVGDRVIVHFNNMLPDSTTIHWHGVRVPSAMDGTMATQSPVQPGASFDYEFTVLDAGTFWYHPHVRSAVQVEQGLYGAILVEDAGEPLADVPSELVVLSDVLVDPDTHELDDTVDDRVMMMGREGNLVLVNGKPGNMRLPARAGEPQRLRIVNAASARFFDLMVHGGTMLRVGGDSGLLEAAKTSESLLLVNGERADVIVWANEPGSTATLVAMPYERAAGAGATQIVELIHWVATDETALSPVEVPDRLRTIEAPSPSMASRMIRLSEEVVGDELLFLINGAAHPDVPVINATVGSSETWTVVNESDMDHPFHLHGFAFLPRGERAWKDTINIPGDTTVTLFPHFGDREGAAGRWMYHCHIFGHAEGGMMGELAAE